MDEGLPWGADDGWMEDGAGEDRGGEGKEKASLSFYDCGWFPARTADGVPGDDIDDDAAASAEWDAAAGAPAFAAAAGGGCETGEEEMGHDSGLAAALLHMWHWGEGSTGLCPAPTIAGARKAATSEHRPLHRIDD
jgi:hypothetical protein